MDKVEDINKYYRMKGNDFGSVFNIPEHVLELNPANNHAWGMTPESGFISGF